MENRLKSLKKSMDKHLFPDLNFTEQHQKAVHKKIQKQDEKEEDIILAVMQLLVHEKTGYELTKHLRARGIRKFEDHEGYLYILLHRLETSGCLQSNWDSSGAKRYTLNDKGRKILRKSEKKHSKILISLKELLEG